MNQITRRDFLKSTGYALGVAGVAGLMPSHAYSASASNELRVLQIGVGGIGNFDRRRIAKHPRVKIVGLCDVHAENLKKVAGEFPDAFTTGDYRIAFADHADKFDAVNVCTPDHTHAAPILLSLAHDKHCYGQKPLVHQLEELNMLEQAAAAKPHLATQTGNQRMNSEGRQLAVEVLSKDMLGPAITAHVWTGSSRGKAEPITKPAPVPVPDWLDWDLWLGPAEKQAYHEKIVPSFWRSWWDFGSAGLGDWGVHLLDVVMYSYPELTSPVTVRTETPRAADWYHTTACKSVMGYEVDSKRFKSTSFDLHYNDSGANPDLRSIGIGLDEVYKHCTALVCENGTLLLEAGGKLTIWNNGKEVPLSELGDLPKPKPTDHWHAWVDQALGKKDHGKVWTPFDVGVRITEASILPVKASRFPGQELEWNREKLVFTNHQEATDTVVRRKYRDGFAPPKVG
jgi:predicted dehydrogenase